VSALVPETIPDAHVAGNELKEYERRSIAGFWKRLEEMTEIKVSAPEKRAS
jgi:hypothetical protein